LLEPELLVVHPTSENSPSRNCPKSLGRARSVAL
jgi:hypothetical protein